MNMNIRKTFFFSFVLIAFFSCKKDTDPNMETFRIVKEEEKVVTTTTTATISGTYEYSGKINSIKVRVGTSDQLFGSDLYVTEVYEDAFSVTITGLLTGTQYYYRYEVDYGASSEFLSEIYSFSTLSDKPTVKTVGWQALDSTTFRVKCEVLSAGGQEVTERGICWNNYGDPIVLDDATLPHSTGGLGQYTVIMEGLELGKRYYVRSYAKSEAGIGYGEELAFETATVPGMPVTIALSCDPVDGGIVTGGGSYPSGTECTVFATANPSYTFVNWTENGVQVSSDATYIFNVTVGRNLVANFTRHDYVITTQADPNEGGTVTGAGGYNYGDECTLNAMAKTGFTFLNWTKNGSVVSTDAQYAFTVTERATYVAHFQANNYVIGVLANPASSGTVSGGGNYSYGQSCMVMATANEGYIFTYWTEDGNMVSREASYTFTVTDNRNLIANFEEHQLSDYAITVSANPSDGGTVTGAGTYNYGTSVTLTANANSGYIFDHWQDGNTANPRTITVTGNATYTAYFTVQPQAPTGAINGKFTINANGDQVYFSKGNLKYSNGTWSFHEHQYDRCFTTDGDVSLYYTANGTFDLFGWGTSGWGGSVATYYRPWDTDNSDGNLYGPTGTNNLTGSYARADWGVNNAISNGGGQAGQWRTLTKEEWDYVFNNTQRGTRLGSVDHARFAKAKVANVQGVILFPDTYTHPSGVALPVGVNETGDTGWNGNNYSMTEFGHMEDNGAVFLPAAGNRNGTLVISVGGVCYYWSASFSSSSNAISVYLFKNYLHASNGGNRCIGQSVRLVCPAE